MPAFDLGADRAQRRVCRHGALVAGIGVLGEERCHYGLTQHLLVAGRDGRHDLVVEWQGQLLVLHHVRFFYGAE